MKSLYQIYKIDSPLEKVWMGLVAPDEIREWSGSEAEMDDKAGDSFSLWDGSVYGKNTKVIEHELLEQDWYGGNWDEPSKVRFELSEEDGMTKVVLTHDNIPDEEADDVEDGWGDYYMGPLKEYLEGRT